MNKKLLALRERELAQQALTTWGRIAPDLFTFERRDGRGTVDHG